MGRIPSGDRQHRRRGQGAGGYAAGKNQKNNKGRQGGKTGQGRKHHKAAGGGNRRLTANRAKAKIIVTPAKAGVQEIDCNAGFPLSRE